MLTSVGSRLQEFLSVRSLSRQTSRHGGTTLPSVLVLTPVKNAKKHLPTYVERLNRFDWPKEKLSVGLLEGDSTDGTWQTLNRLAPALNRRAGRTTLVKQDFGFQLPAGVPRWAPQQQYARRTVLAKARNHLLFRALREEDWVLWLDVDVIDFPPDIISKLIAVGHDIVHPHCVTAYGGKTFDLNAWSDHGTQTLHDMRGRGLVPLDSVGGTMLLVRAERHRDGLIFPPFPYGVANSRARPEHPLWGKGEIETEGLGIMALDMGLQCWGLPDLEILHAPE